MRRRTAPPSDLHLAIAVYRLACYNESRQHRIRINHVFRLMRYSVTTSCNGRPGHKFAALVSTPSKKNTATGQAAQTPARGCSGVPSRGTEGTIGLQSCTGQAIRLIAAIARLPLSVSAVAPHRTVSCRRSRTLVSAWCDSVFNLDPAIPLLSR